MNTPAPTAARGIEPTPPPYLSPGFNDLLVPHDRPIRIPLPVWAASIRNRLSLSLKADDIVIQCHGVVHSFGEAALVEVFFGRLNYAMDLCYAALAWTAWMIEKTHNLTLAKFALHSWINIARLNRIKGHWQLALAQFKDLQHVLERDEFRIENIHFSSSSWSRICEQDPELLTTVKTAYIVETLKTILRASHYQDLLAFADNAGSESAMSLLDFLLEARVISLVHCRRESLALELIEKRLSDASRRINRPIFLLRRAECLLFEGSFPEGTSLLKRLAQAFHDPSVALGFTKLTVLARLAGLLANSDPSETLKLAYIGSNAATLLNDIVLQMRFLEIAKRLSTGEASESARRSMAELRRNSLYGAAGHPELTEQAKLNIIDDLYDRLMSLARQDRVLESASLQHNI